MDIELLLLANSRKAGGRCLAGLRTDTWEWVRPVSAASHHSLPVPSTRTATGVLRPLDIVRCQLVKHEPQPHQSENWRVLTTSIRHIRRSPLDDVRHRLDTVTHDNPFFMNKPAQEINAKFYLGKSSPRPSLALIRVPSVEITVTARGGALRDRVRVTFTHQDNSWDLPFTDDHFPRTGTRQRLGESYLCISVGDLFPSRNSHYKLVAGIIPESSESRAPAPGIPGITNG